MRLLYVKMLAAFTILSAGASPALAGDEIDITTVQCHVVNSMVQAKSMDLLGLMSMLSGYHATEAQGTIVDGEALKAAIDKTAGYCADHPNVSVVSASEKFMGENLPEPGSAAIDVSSVTCEKVAADSKGATDMWLNWLSGYHLSRSKDATMYSPSKFESDTAKIKEFCKQNPAAGLLTASEKFMSKE